MANKYGMLLSPFQIRNVKLKNRIVKPSQGLRECEDDGSVSEVQMGHYEALAKGGVGLIIAASTCPDYPVASSAKRRLRTDDDKFIPGLKKLSDVIHKYGTPAFAQITHAGPSHIMHATGIQPVAASALKPEESPVPYWPMARALTVGEIQGVIEKYVLSAERIRKAGFDGVELHFGHYTLVNCFLSRAWNKRQDEYGPQDIKSRTRMAVEIVRAIKQRVGEDFPVGARINGREWDMPLGITFEESEEFSKLMAEAGMDWLQVSGFGSPPCNERYMFPELLLYPEPTEAETLAASYVKQPGLHAVAAARIKKAVKIPIMAVGRMGPELGEYCLRTGKLDLVIMGRRLLADPELPNKLAAGRYEDIAPCTACLDCFGSLNVIHAVAGDKIRCRVNASLAREREYAIKPADKKKKVMVVGGGPAGMEAARVAALRGHHVELYEKEAGLGGVLPLAALVKGTEVEDIPALVRYLSTQVTKAGVTVKLGQEVTSALVEQVKPDAVILATGAVQSIPDIPGIKGRNVITSEDLHRQVKRPLRFFGPEMLARITKYYLPVGKRVVILGGLIHGCETAEFLVKRGRQVTVAETSGALGTGIIDMALQRLLPWLAKKGSTLLTNVKYQEVTDKGLVITTKEGEKKLLEADTVLVAMPPAPNTALLKSLQGKVAEVHIIGDAREPSRITDAVAEGARVGRVV